MGEEFDLHAWKSEAQQALESLLAKREEAKKLLAGLDTEISGIQSALGMGPAPVKRTRLRAPILNILGLNKEPVLIDTLISQLAVDGVTEAQVVSAVHRTVRDCENVIYGNEENSAVTLK